MTAVMFITIIEISGNVCDDGQWCYDVFHDPVGWADLHFSLSATEFSRLFKS